LYADQSETTLPTPPSANVLQQMGKKNNKSTHRNTSASTSTSAITANVKVIGVLADDLVIRTAAVAADQPIGTVVRTIADDLQTHINSAFSLREQGIIIETDTVLIPGERITYCAI